IQSVTQSKNVAFVGYSHASNSMFGLLSTLPKFHYLIKPFISISRAQYIGKSTKEFATIAPLFGKVNNLYVPPQVLAQYLTEHDRSPAKGNKVCAVLILEPLE